MNEDAKNAEVPAFEMEPEGGALTPETMSLALQSLRDVAHNTAKSKGFWDENHSFLDRLCLIHSELSEAAEEYRKGYAPAYEYYREDGKPEGIGAELADAIIRCFDLAGRYDIDLGRKIVEKMQFNTTRPYKHGKVS